MYRAYVALGANLGDPVAQVRSALTALGDVAESALVGLSSLYRTAPIGYTDQPDFINAVAALDTLLAPRHLLDALLSIEVRFGRERTFANAPRTLDLDLLLYDRLEVREAGLEIPHPRMHERVFVLAPLVEIAPEVEIPGRGRALDLLARLPEQGVGRMDAP
ncbi:MAG: 2-amino-4-hydroxy-6-hydroxymethyldihydropteridine diphosphokinase [Burkholderiales bacterium]